MKRYFSFGLIIVLIVTLIVGCSGGSKEANAPATDEQQTAQPNDPAKEEPKAEDSSKPTKDDSQRDKVVVAEKDKTEHSNGIDSGHTLKATYPANDHKLLVEVDQSKEVVKGVPVNYLYIQYGDNGIKRLLAQSVDRGNDWTNSVATILNPTISNDGKKVYFETDNTFTRTNGYGANNHRTYWVDLTVDMETLEYYYFEEGGIKKLLDSNYGPYEDHLILEINSLDVNGKPAFVYPVVSPKGDKVVILDSFDPNMDFVKIIDSKLGSNSPKEKEDASTDPTLNLDFKVVKIPFNGVYKDDLKVTYHGKYIEHSRYAVVVVEDYPTDGEYPFKYAMYYDNPAYSDHPNTYTVAVMGEINNVWIKSKSQMDADYLQFKIASKIEDSLIEVASSFPTDFSVDVITFEDYAGKSYELHIDDMSDEKSVIAIKLPY